MNRNLKLYFLLLNVVLSAGVSYGQSTMMNFLSELKQINNGKHISYKYEVIYIDESVNKVVDSVSGRLYKDDGRFVDDNNLMLSACTNGYYCKVEKEKKIVHVYNSDLFQKYLGINVTEEASSMVIPDSFIFRHGQVLVDTLSNGNYTVTINVGLDIFDKAFFEINRKTYLIAAARLEMFEPVAAANKVYKKVYIIKDVKYNYDKDVFELRNIYKVKNGIVSLNRKYKNYNLKTLTK